MSMLSALGPGLAGDLFQAAGGSPLPPLVLCVLLLVGGAHLLVNRAQRGDRD